MEHTKEHTDIGQYPDAEDRMWIRLWNLLDNPGDDELVYIYRADKFERPIKPFSAKFWLPGIDLIWILQTEFGGGLFRLLIRSGRTIKFSGVVGVEGTRPFTVNRPISY